MRSTVLTPFLSLSLSLLAPFVNGCGDDASSLTSESFSTEATESPDDTNPDGSDGTTKPGRDTLLPGSDDPAAPSSDAGSTGAGDDAGSKPSEPDTPTAGDPGPKPTASCDVQKGSDGFFVRNSGKSSYVAYVPASYTGKEPMRLIVGLHGCGDNAKNFATWGVNPYQTRSTQTHIGISVDGATGGNSCWSMGGDDDKVLAAVEDISKCFWVHQKKIAIAGYSSGGQLAYRVGLKNASRFAGILIENSSLYAADSNPDALVANASRKIPIAHRAHKNDSVFALSKVQADWAKLKSAGFPLTSSVVDGDHSGSNVDWADFLIPASADWAAP